MFGHKAGSQRHPTILTEKSAPETFLEKMLARPIKLAYINSSQADMAQLVEHNLAKVGVAGSSPVVRSIVFTAGFLVIGFFLRRLGQVVRQRPAKPLPPVRIWEPPPSYFKSTFGCFFIIAPPIHNTATRAPVHTLKFASDLESSHERNLDTASSGIHARAIPHTS